MSDQTVHIVRPYRGRPVFGKTGIKLTLENMKDVELEMMLVTNDPWPRVHSIFKEAYYFILFHPMYVMDLIYYEEIEATKEVCDLVWERIEELKSYEEGEPIYAPSMPDGRLPLRVALQA